MSKSFFLAYDAYFALCEPTFKMKLDKLLSAEDKKEDGTLIQLY